MKKITYEMKLLSSLIVSPRSGQAFYYGIDHFSQEPMVDLAVSDFEKNKREKVKVVYPFYQYGEYTKYDPEHAEYYLPGSTVKGALLQKDKKSDNGKVIDLMADDVRIDRNHIVLRNLVKAQYIEQKGKAAFKPFFENVGIEMVRGGTILHGELYLKEDEEFTEAVRNADAKTKQKMQQMCKYLEKLLDGEGKNKEFAEQLNNIKENLFSLIGEKNIILIGGYKGLLHSIIMPKKRKEEVSSGVYIDQEKNLPHGLVKIEQK